MSQTPRVDEALRQVVGPAVLDLGCSGQAGRRSNFTSENWLHGRLMRAFPDAWGLESSSENIAALSAAGIGNIHQGDAQDFNLGRRFNTVVAGELIEHLPNIGDFLDAVRQHLEPGGRLVITTPYPFNVFFMMYAWYRYPRTCSNPEHTMWFCPSTIRTVASLHGYQLVSNRLVADYRRDLPSRAGRVIGYFGRAMRWFAPLRLCGTSMVVVLQPLAVSAT